VDKVKFFKTQQSHWAYVAFFVELGCMAVGAYYSWVASVAVMVAVLTQAGWQCYLEEQAKAKES